MVIAVTPETILVVEDDRFFRELYADILHEAGYGVLTADSGEQALACLAVQKCGLVITDLVMPGMSGVELLAAIKAREPSIDVVLVTAHADLESALLALRHGARDYLLKPIRSEELLHIVRLCLEQRHLISENFELRTMLGLVQTSQVLSGCLDLDGVCHLAVDACARELGVGRGIALVRREKEVELHERKGITQEIAAALVDQLVPLLGKRGFRSKNPFRFEVASEHAGLETADLREALVIPLTVRSGCQGAVVLLNDHGAALPDIKNERNIEFLQEHAARALDNAARFSATRELLYIDELSGLFNYRYLKLALEREIKRADRYSTQLSAVFLDLDDFKRVNDTLGHLLGSKLLRELGKILKNSVREVDVVIRYGGDEYTLLLVETGPETSWQVCERIRSMIEQHQFLSQDGQQVRVTASLGFASYPEDTSSLDELLNMADQAMYAGKAAGKNCVYRLAGALQPERKE